ncbi:MAG: hypothetical protein LZF86_190133 [Nitrospira sp.]|nr:MAG: hypothetical protein LZF86_190133 [Nitrospira sp.]
MPDPSSLVRIVPMCELCRRVYDHGTDSGRACVWTQLHGYVARHRLHPQQVVFSPSYCTACKTGYALATTYGRH